MINFFGCRAQGIAVANGVITLALLEHLIERKILTRADVRTILGSGIECLEPRINVRSVADADHVIARNDHRLLRGDSFDAYRPPNKRRKKPPLRWG